MDEPIRDAVVADIIAKYNAGMEEHGGKGLHTAGFSKLEYLENAYEEAMDLCVYLKGAILDATNDKK